MSGYKDYYIAGEEINESRYKKDVEKRVKNFFENASYEQVRTLDFVLCNINDVRAATKLLKRWAK